MIISFILWPKYNDRNQLFEKASENTGQLEVDTPHGFDHRAELRTFLLNCIS